MTATAYIEKRILRRTRQGKDPSTLLVTQEVLDQFKLEMSRNPRAGNWTSGKHFAQVFVPAPLGGTMICHIIVKEWHEKLMTEKEARLKIQ